MKRVILLLVLGALLLGALGGCKVEQEKEIEESSLQESAEETADASSLPPESSFPGEESDEVSIDTETPGEALEGQFGEYSFVYEEDGLQVVTIYSYEQVTDFAERRAKGEWFSLSAREIEYLILDTKELFDTYDVIRVRDLDGSMATYYGAPFYGSEAYYDCFGGFDMGIAGGEYSFAIRQTVLLAAYTRIRVLNSACVDANAGRDPDHLNKLVLSDAEVMTEERLKELVKYHTDVYILGGKSDAFREETGNFYYFKIFEDVQWLEKIENISKGKASETTKMLSGDFGYTGMGRYKYDNLCRNVVIELWSEETQQLVARIRVDENSHPEVIEELERRCGEFRFAADDELSPPTHHYRVGVYLNGFSVPMGGGVLEDIAFVYYPEGDTDQYNLIINIPVFFDYGNGVPQLGMRGSKSIADLANRLLEETLTKDAG